MSKIFLIDVGKCTGCYNCQLACKDEHCENDWTPYAAPQPLTGHFWCRVTVNIRKFILPCMTAIHLWKIIGRQTTLKVPRRIWGTYCKF